MTRWRCDPEAPVTVQTIHEHLPAMFMSFSPILSSVHCPAVLCGRAEDVSRFQLLCVIPLHVAARPPNGCNHAGL